MIRVWMSLFFLLATSGASLYAQPPESTLSSYESAKHELDSMKAHFVQKKIFTLFEETDTSEGEVWFKRPNQVLWRFQSPALSDTILSGENSWSVIPSTKQVQKINVAGGNSNRLFEILGFGGGDEKLEDSFEVKEIPAAVDEKGMKLLSLIPKEESLKPYYSEIIVKLSVVDYLPRHVILKEKSGDVTEILLSDVESNISVDNSLFEFKIPEGYQLIDYNQ